MRRSIAAFAPLLLLAWLAACDAGEEDHRERPQACFTDSDPDGPPCVERIRNKAEFEVISISTEPSVSFPAVRATKYMVPVSDDPDLLPPLLQNVNRYPYHIEFLRAYFPERFADLTTKEYLDLVMYRETRKYYAGNFFRFNDPLEGEFYGFTLYSVGRTEELLEPKEVLAVYRMLEQAVSGRLAYTFDPYDAAARLKAKSWIDPGFPIYFPQHDDVTVEVYTPGVTYGRVRRFTLAEFNAATREGRLSWQDLVVLDQVPFDIETVVAGVVTGSRQWELSHVNVRMSRRGTPNLYLKDPLSAFEPYEGKLVRLEAIKSQTATVSDSVQVDEADQVEAEAFWAEHRPDLGELEPVDRDYRELHDLQDLGQRYDARSLIRRVGGKAANLARLYTFLPQCYQVPGFAIPFAWFEDFMERNTLMDQRVEPPVEVTYREYIARLVNDERFRTDAVYRRQILWDFRTRARTEGQVDPDLVAALVKRIRETFGSTGVKVRFRSSSNVEDSLEFSGAGLYSSTSVCADDTLDQDLDGPSRCDPGQDEERTVERGLKKVWTSLYNDRAWEEREWYQVPQDRASMAILVTLAFPDELANGVAFTGNPTNAKDLRYLVNVQLGDEPVVGNDPRLMPEKDLIKVKDGEVSKIYRVRSSPLVEPGSYVLSDEQLHELGRLMFDIDEEYPLDTGDYERDQVLLDLEFKIDRENRLRIKQIRPFLKGEGI